VEIRDLLSDGGFRFNALIMVRLFAKDLRATGNGFRNAPVPAIPSDSERGMVALRKHCETALRSGPEREGEYVRSPQNDSEVCRFPGRIGRIV
jgi:hypothetical protein